MMSATGRPRVVACMPVWNAQAFIEPVLDSLAAQTYPNLAVRISVDVSSDDSAGICERFAAVHPDTEVVRQTRRLGWVRNSNALLETAAGEYVFFAMHDDVLDALFVERLVDALERNPRAVLAFSDVASNVGTTFSYDVLDGISDRFERARRVLHAEGNWWVPFRGLMRGAGVRRLGGLQRHRAGEFSADWPWLLRLALAGEFVRVPEPLVCKRFHAGSLSAIWRKGRWNALSVQLACWNVVAGAGFSSTRLLYVFSEAILFGFGVTRCPRPLRGLKNMVLGEARR